MRAISVSARDSVRARETIQRGKARAVRVEPEHRATAAVATVFCRSIQGTVRQNQFGIGTGAVAIGPKRTRRDAKRMQDAKSCAISVDSDYCAITSAASLARSSIQR